MHFCADFPGDLKVFRHTGLVGAQAVEPADGFDGQVVFLDRVHVGVEVFAQRYPVEIVEHADFLHQAELFVDRCFFQLNRMVDGRRLRPTAITSDQKILGHPFLPILVLLLP